MVRSGFGLLPTILRDVLFLSRRLPRLIWRGLRSYGVLLRHRARCRRLIGEYEAERLDRLRRPGNYRGE